MTYSGSEPTPSVILVASGYEWTCENCGTLNHEPEVPAIDVNCERCGNVYEVRDYIHATGH